MREQLILTQTDQLKLRELVEHLLAAGGVSRESLEALTERIRRARVVAHDSVPRDVVTMNSLVGLRDMDRNETWSCTVAYPHDADLVSGRVSVAVPLGTRLLGQRVGDTVQCPAPSGLRTLRIERVYYQPEAAGHYYL